MQSVIHKRVTTLVCLVVVVFVFCNGGCSAQKIRPKRVGGVGGIEDNEEDEAWKEWGKKVERPLPEVDLNKDVLSPEELQNLQTRGLSGTKLAFAYLYEDTEQKRSMDDVNKRAKQWMTLLGTGGLQNIKIYATDPDAIILQLEDGRALFELKDFCLSQPDIDYFRFNNQNFFREGEEREIVYKKEEKKKKKRKKSSKSHSTSKEL